jgi:hypothetical protein
MRLSAPTSQLSANMNQARTLVLVNMQAAAQGAAKSSNNIALSLAAVTAAMNLATFAAGALGAALATIPAMVQYAANTFDVLASMELTFGTRTRGLIDTIEAQGRAFGYSKQELAGYADIVGRELQTLGVPLKETAQIANETVKAISQLAMARNISPETAFRQIKSGAMLFNQDEIRGFAWENKLLITRNQHITAGTEELIRYQLALEDINTSTENTVGAGRNWNDQLDLTTNAFRDMFDVVGHDLEPAFMSILDIIRSWIPPIKSAMEYFAIGIGYLTGNGEETLARVAGGSTTDPFEQAKRDQENDERAARHRRRTLLGEALGASGGGGQTYQGSFAGYHAKIQEAAWQANTLQQLERQTVAAEKLVSLFTVDKVQMGPKQFFKGFVPPF